MAGSGEGGGVVCGLLIVLVDGAPISGVEGDDDMSGLSLPPHANMKSESIKTFLNNVISVIFSSTKDSIYLPLSASRGGFDVSSQCSKPEWCWVMNLSADPVECTCHDLIYHTIDLRDFKF